MIANDTDIQCSGSGRITYLIIEFSLGPCAELGTARPMENDQIGFFLGGASVRGRVGDWFVGKSRRIAPLVGSYSQGLGFSAAAIPVD